MEKSQDTVKIENLIANLRQDKTLSDDEFKALLVNGNEMVSECLFQNAREVCRENYGNKIYTRGLIEFTNYCRNNCYYCGIRRENQNVQRYRLTDGQILNCVKEGYALGFRTFVLQGGEDACFTKEKLGGIIKKIKAVYPDCAVTISFGEWDREAYQFWHDCGADRYLLRHETADASHYRMLHPTDMCFFKRMACIKQLKAIGYQVGAGFMVGSPGQTADMLIRDLRFLEELQPHMVGIGPFIPQKDTPFSKNTGGALGMVLKLLSILRLMLPKTLLPSTTALGSIHPRGRELGILAGANVVMPNLSPNEVRGKYLLYDNKLFTGEESAQSRESLEAKIQAIGYELSTERGDSLMESNMA